MKIQHDVHMHTYLSRCSNDPDFLPPAIIEKSKANGIRLLGFTDHMWDKSMPGGDNDVYRNQDYEHVNKIHNMMPDKIEGIKILFGCETEYYGKGRIGISKETAAKFDFVIAPTNHTLTFYAKEEKLTTAMEIAKDLIKRLKEVLSFNVATGICHPMLPLGFFNIGDEIFNSISNEEFNECFSMAREKGVSLEINSCTFPGIYDRGTTGFTDEAYMRFFTLAKEAGCKFHFGSDSHSLEDIDRLQKLEPYLDLLKITEDDVLPFFRI
jgi:histidinol phosphatase-like PHP family hydrolase